MRSLRFFMVALVAVFGGTLALQARVAVQSIQAAGEPVWEEGEVPPLSIAIEGWHEGSLLSAIQSTGNIGNVRAAVPRTQRDRARRQPGTIVPTSFWSANEPWTTKSIRGRPELARGPPAN